MRRQNVRRGISLSIPVAIDLFSGGGALTVGLKRAGFAVVAAVEIEKHAFATYVANHPEVNSYKQDVRAVKGVDLLESTDDGVVDLLAGCPPCQGFTSLTSKYRTYDARNDLIREMARLIEEVRPRAVMMENVPGIVGRGKPLLDEFRDKIECLGYDISAGVLQLADYGVPQSRRRFVLLAGRGFSIPLPKPTHSKRGEDGFKRWRTVRDVIGDLEEPMTLSEAKARSAVDCADWHLISSMTDVNRKRLKCVNPGASRLDIPDRLRPRCHRGAYSGFSNVYGRMEWDEVSPTITAGCTTLSKGRFGHPEQHRTISVREAALLQSMPSDYKIDTPYIQYACSIVGNALPCDFAEVVAKRCVRSLSDRSVAEHAGARVEG